MKTLVPALIATLTLLAACDGYTGTGVTRGTSPMAQDTGGAPASSDFHGPRGGVR